MKTRQGFVSNSSSSSFVVAFDKIPESKEELRTMLFFSGQKFYPNPFWDEHYSRETDAKDYPIEDVLEIVWLNMQKPCTETEWDIEGSGPMTPEQIRQEFENGWIEGQPETNWSRIPSYQENPEECNRIMEADSIARKDFGNEEADAFIARNEGKFFFRFNYSDNDGDMNCAMEHGELFYRLHHFKISHH